MKKAVYIILSILLGVILSFIVHALIEGLYLKWAISANRAITWTMLGQNSCALPLWLIIILPILGAIGGFFLGRFWWKKIYEEGRDKKRINDNKLLIILSAILAIVIILASTYFLKHYLYLKSQKDSRPSPTVSQTFFTTPTFNPTPSADVSLKPTPAETAEPTTTPEIPSNSPIPIYGDESCVSDTTEALNMLSSLALDHYNATLEYIGLIECADQGSGVYVWENPVRYKVGDSTRSDSGTMWYASTFAHEACHSKQYHDGRTYSGEEAETECLNAQYSALEQMGASQSTLDYVRGLADTRYWEIPYENRWW